jgi:hypothetical protein
MTSPSEPEVRVELRVTAAWPPARGRLAGGPEGLALVPAHSGPPPAVARLTRWLEEGGFELTSVVRRGRRVRLAAVGRWGGDHSP